jgi:hypothetical protein
MVRYYPVNICNFDFDSLRHIETMPRKIEEGGYMKGDCRRKLITVFKAAFFGFLGATAMVHITLLFMPVMRDFENRYFSERHTESEIATLLIVGFLTLTMEPVFYIVKLAVSLEKHGPVTFLWLAPVGITQSYACVKWAIRKKSDQ